MAWRSVGLAALALMGWSGAAHADERDFCADRPGKDTPSCTLDPGRFQIEAGLLDYSHSRDRDTVENDVSSGDLLLRYGVNDSLEARAEWQGYSWSRSRDRASGQVDHANGSGDLTLSFRQNLRHPDDTGTAFAIQPSITLPVGRNPIGAGTWSAGVIVPFGVDLVKNWRLNLDPEIDAAADADRHGRHLAYALAASITHPITQALQLSVEGWAMRDDDPTDHQTQASVDFTAAWQPTKNSAIDLSTNIGVTHATPRIELALGMSRRF